MPKSPDEKDIERLKTWMDAQRKEMSDLAMNPGAKSDMFHQAVARFNALAQAIRNIKDPP